jgi:hypothetical protein
MTTKNTISLEQAYDLVLEAVNHKALMQKRYNLPEDVAEYLHTLNSKNSWWFGREISEMAGYKNATNKLDWIRGNLSGQIQGIVDWLTSGSGPNNNPELNRPQEGKFGLKSLNWDEALRLQDEWHVDIGNNEHIEIKGDEKLPIVKKYKNGLYWCDLGTANSSGGYKITMPNGRQIDSKDEERSLMGHCASDPRGETMFSLRMFDPKTGAKKAFVTATLSPTTGNFYQIKGPMDPITREVNTKPDQKYWKYIADLLIKYKCFIYNDGGHKEQNDYRDDNFIVSIRGFKDTYPNKEELIKKASASKILRENKAKFLRISGNFKQHENEFIEMNDEDKESYILSNYQIYTFRALNSLNPVMKQSYIDRVTHYPDRAINYVILLLEGGKSLNEIDPEIYNTIASQPRILDQFIDKLLNSGIDVDDNETILDLISRSPEKSYQYVINLILNKNIKLKSVPARFIERIESKPSANFKFIDELLKNNIDFEKDPNILNVIASSAEQSHLYISNLILKDKVKPKDIEKRFIDAVSSNQSQADALTNKLFGSSTNFGILPENFLILLSPVTAFKYTNYLLDTQKLLVNQINPDLIIKLDKSSGKSYEFIDKLITLGQEKLLYKDKRIPDTIRSLVPKILNYAMESEDDPIKKQNFENRLETLDKSDKAPIKGSLKTKKIQKSQPAPTPEEDDDEGFDINF